MVAVVIMLAVVMPILSLTDALNLMIITPDVVRASVGDVLTLYSSLVSAEGSAPLF